jgi:hypothetical protein
VLRYRVRDERVLRLKVENVVLVERESPLCLAALIQRCGVQCLVQLLGLREVDPGQRVEARVLAPRLPGETLVCDCFGRDTDSRQGLGPGGCHLLQCAELPGRDVGNRVRPRRGSGGERLGGSEDVTGRPQYGVLRLHQVGQPTGRIWNLLKHHWLQECGRVGAAPPSLAASPTDRSRASTIQWCRPIRLGPRRPMRSP